MDGIISINKIKGVSSFYVVKQLRKILKERRIGHTGTLDPLANGLLVICIGKATKLASSVEATSKEYVADFVLGYETTTYDLEGDKTRTSDKQVDKGTLLQALETFKGESEQEPPMYSALKVNGQPLYKLARQGIEVERKKRKVEITAIELIDFDVVNGQLRVEVSKGTYIRSLIRDLGVKLGSYATMTDLKRTRVGEYSLERASTIEEIEECVNRGDYSFLKSVEESFPYEKISLSDANEKLFKNGNTVVLKSKCGLYRVYHSNKFIGLGEVKNNRLKGYKYFSVGN